MPELSVVRVPVVAGGQRGKGKGARQRVPKVRYVDWPCVAPHEIVGQMLRHNLLTKLVGNWGPADLVSWWEQASATWARNHPALDTPELLPHSIPLRLHLDEGTGQRKRPVLIVQISSVASHGHSLDTHYLVTVVPSRLYYKTRTNRGVIINHTVWCILRFVVWSLKQLMIGKWPRVWFTGEPIRGHGLRAAMAGSAFKSPWRACYAGCKGDWKGLREAYAMPRHYNAAYCCFHCWASQTSSPTLWTDLSDEAGWRLTTESTEDYLAATPDMEKSPLLELPGWGKSMVLIGDLLHVLFHRGCAADFVASMVVECCDRGVFHCGCNLERSLKAAYCRFKEWCSVLGLHTQLEELSRNNLNYTSRVVPATLSAKGANVKLLVHWIADVARLHQVGAVEDLWAQVAVRA